MSTAAAVEPRLVRATPELLAKAPAVVRHHLATLPVHRAIIRVVECLLVGAEEFPHPVLDVGCGDGHFVASCLSRVQSARFKVQREGDRGSERDGGSGAAVDAGIDPDPRSAAEAHRSGGYKQVFVGSAAQLPFEDESFASVVSNCVLEHIPPLDESLREIARVLRPGGKLVITVPSERFASSLFWPQALRSVGLDGRAEAYGRWFNGISRHFHTYTRDEWMRHLQEAGLRVQSWTSYLQPDAMGFFDLSHYYGAPTLVSKRLTGRWILWPGKRRYLPWERWLEGRLTDFAQQIAVPDGAYYFFSAVKA